MPSVYRTDFSDITLKQRGKVRDVYELGDKLLIVATDRISAFDVIMNEAIPEKGKILSSISDHWFKHTGHIVKNHLISNNVDEYPEELRKHKEELQGRSMLVRKCKVFPVECIVRGYVAGSGWKEYRKSNTICGIPIVPGLQEFSKLPEPIFTPSTKADVGHDENISPDQAAEIIGKENAELLSKYSIELYKFASDYLEKRGLILADTKFEFGFTDEGEIILIDEVLTPDSSRFWLKEEYAPGKEQINFDKQVLRDYLESVNWDKTPPPPTLPEEIIVKTGEKYREALRRVLQ